jgi:hypothetical protein
MMAAYDTDPVDAVTTALRSLTGRTDASWEELALVAATDPDRRAALLAGDPAALDDLVTELNELRQLDARRLARETMQRLRDR